MESLQTLAGKVFNGVSVDKLSVHYANAMGFLIDEYSDNNKFSTWVHNVAEREVEKLLTCLVRYRRWGDSVWLNKYITHGEHESAA
jgi:hypothetical protein